MAKTFQMFLSCTLVGFLLLIQTGCSLATSMKTPSFTVASSQDTTVHAAIREALLGRRWVILENLPDSFVAQYNRRSSVWARIRVSHHGNLVTITYVASEGLKYSTTRRFGPEISRWYNTWVSNLEDDIKFNIGASL